MIPLYNQVDRVWATGHYDAPQILNESMVLKLSSFMVNVLASMFICRNTIKTLSQNP